MKKLILLSAITVGTMCYTTANAQVAIHIGFNWFPHRVYTPVPPPPPVVDQPVYDDQQPVYDDQQPVDNDANDDYYYLPDEEAYYNVPQHCYYYNDGYNWVSAPYLPGYVDFDWRSARRFEVRAFQPYMHHDFYRSRWGGFNGSRGFNNHYNGGYANNGRFDHGYDRHFDNRGFGGNPNDRQQYYRSAPQPNFNHGGNNFGGQPQHGGGNYGGGQSQNHGGGFPGGGQSQNHGGGFQNNGQHFAQNNSRGMSRQRF